MKIQFVCDCCDRIFSEAELPEDEGSEGCHALTGEERHDIILQDRWGSGTDHR